MPSPGLAPEADAKLVQTYEASPFGWIHHIPIWLYSRTAVWPTSLTAILVGHWANQSHLALATWCNRGSAKGGVAEPARPSSPAFVWRAPGKQERELLQAYTLAIATAVPVTFGAAVLPKRVAALRPLQRFAPYPGAAAANAAGCWAMRRQDFVDGLPVRPVREPLMRPGEPLGPVGQSRAAGRAAVRDTALTRLALPAGNFLGVPLLLWALERARGGAKAPLVVQVGVTAMVFSVWLPIATSLFPPVVRMPVAELEEEAVLRALPPGTRYVEYDRGA